VVHWPRFEWPAVGSSYNEFFVCGLVIMGAFVVVKSKSALMALLTIGFIGYCIAIIYAIGSGPDLAITQVLVETVTVILTVFLISQIPLRKTKTGFLKSGKRFILAASIGVIVLFVGLVSMQSEMKSQMLPDFFRQASLPLAH